MTDLNKEKRESFFDVVVADQVTKVIQQVTTYRKKFSGGCQHLILGRITILLVNLAIAGLQIGSSGETRFQTGERLKCRVHFYGCTGNVCQSLAFAVEQGLKCTFFFLVSQRELEKAFFGM